MRYLRVAAIVLSLFIVTGMQFANVIQANPYQLVTIPPPAGVHSFVEIYSPQNNTVTCKNRIFLNFTAGVGSSEISYIREGFTVSYKPDWEPNSTLIYTTPPNAMQSLVSFASKAVTLTNVPEGNHTVICYVGIDGKIITPAVYPNLGLIQYFSFSNSTSVSFFVDTIAPKITDITIDNNTYNSSNVTSSFKVSEPVSKLSYSLDSQGNVTIRENALNFTDLVNGVHNVTIFATDNVGNIGQSETMYFYVKLPEPFPIVSVLIASIISIVIIVVTGLLVYLKRRANRFS